MSATAPRGNRNISGSTKPLPTTLTWSDDLRKRVEHDSGIDSWFTVLQRAPQGSDLQMLVVWAATADSQGDADGRWPFPNAPAGGAALLC